jgi:hypothetical protein
MKKLFTVSLLAALCVPFAGCDTTTRNAPGNTTLGAATLGGVTGAAIGAHNSGTKGAVVGGLLGAAGGGLIGNQMERNRDAAYGQPYGAPQQQYAPAPGYAPQQPAYAAPSAGGSAGYGAPAPGFGAPPPQSF